MDQWQGNIQRVVHVINSCYLPYQYAVRTVLLSKIPRPGDDGKQSHLSIPNLGGLKVFSVMLWTRFSYSEWKPNITWRFEPRILQSQLSVILNELLSIILPARAMPRYPRSVWMWLNDYISITITVTTQLLMFQIKLITSDYWKTLRVTQVRATPSRRRITSTLRVKETM